MTNFIEEYQLTDLSICDALIELYHEAEKRGLVTPGCVGGPGNINKDFKESKDFFLNKALEIGSPSDYKFDLYHKELDSFINDYLKKYKLTNQKFTSRFLPQIQYYEKGQGYYAWHADGGSLDACDRAFVYITYLNDVEDGGTEFYHQDYITTARKGNTVLFPASYTHLHKGQISQTNEKYILTGWIWWA